MLSLNIIPNINVLVWQHGCRKRHGYVSQWQDWTAAGCSCLLCEIKTLQLKYELCWAEEKKIMKFSYIKIAKNRFMWFSCGKLMRLLARYHRFNILCVCLYKYHQWCSAHVCTHECAFYAHAWLMPLAHCMHVCSIWFTGMHASLRCSISLVCYGLQWWPKKGDNPCSVQSCHLLSQHDPAWPWGSIIVPQK